jgi:hypothetical protein
VSVSNPASAAKASRLRFVVSLLWKQAWASPVMERTRIYRDHSERIRGKDAR